MVLYKKKRVYRSHSTLSCDCERVLETEFRFNVVDVEGCITLRKVYKILVIFVILVIFSRFFHEVHEIFRSNLPLG